MPPLNERLTRRRGFLRTGLRGAAGLVLASACGPVSVPVSPQPSRVPRVGVLVTSLSANRADYEAFREGMQALGWTDGQNVRFEVSSAEGDTSRYDALAATLVDRPVDVIVVASSQAASAARGATRTIPIVMAGVQEPVALGLIENLAHPGGNVTGMSRLTTLLGAKRLELLKDVVTALTRVAMLSDSSAAAGLGLAEIQAAAPGFGLEIQALSVRTVDDFAAAVASATRARAGALITNGALFQAQRTRLAELVVGARLPSIHADRSYVEAGLLMSYGEERTYGYRHAATYVDKILKGAKPADLPVEQPTALELAINLKTAEVLGVTIPSQLAAQVTHWIK